MGNGYSLFSTSFVNVSSFVEISVGSINFDHKSEYFNNIDIDVQSRITAYKVSAGLTFELDNGHSFSLAVGTGDTAQFNSL